MQSLFRWGATLALLLAAGAAVAESEVEAAAKAVRTVEGTVLLPAPDLAKTAQEDAEGDAKNLPGGWRFAIPFKTSITPAADGEWLTPGPDGRRQWRQVIEAPGAEHLNFGFRRYALTPGASLLIRALDGKASLGPYTAADNDAHGELWTPVLASERVAVELTLAPGAEATVDLELSQIGYGYRGFGAKGKLCKSGACNTDVACLGAASPWNFPRRATASYSTGGSRFCTGQLLNNTRRDRRMLFSTATHCDITAANAPSMVVFWNFESPTCRAPGSAESDSEAVVGPTNQTQSGAILIARTNAHVNEGSSIGVPAGTRSDWTLVELDDPPNPAFQLYWAGWDRRPVAAQCSGSAPCAAIHHPDGDEKRITFSEAPLTQGNWVLAQNVHWRVDWDPTPPFLPNFPAGTPNPPPPAVTEGGSSGGALLNPLQRVVGVLSGGPSFCSATGSDLADFYGQLAAAWEGIGTPATRMRDHLDPLNSGAEVLDGLDSCAAPTLALEVGSGGSGNAGQAVALNLAITGQGPYTVAWDVDADGLVDRRQTGVRNSATLSTVYPEAGSRTVSVQVTDAAGCVAATQRTLALAGPDITATAGTPSQVCGDGDGAVEPGEVFRLPVTLRNNGARTLTNGFAVFTPSAGGGGSTIGGSAFGYRMADNTSGLCPYQFVDIGSQPALPLTPASAAFPAEDDGRSAPITLNRPFNVFGSSVSQLVMSTNGYISTSTLDDGGDFSAADCPLPLPDDGGAGSHLRPLHADFVVQQGGGLRSQYFASCPRPRDTAGSGGCTVFQWTNMGSFLQGGGAQGAAEFQAILYDDSFQLVFQYRAADPQAGGVGGIGLISTNGTDRQQYACREAGSAGPGRAVCTFHPSALPGALTPAPLVLDTPAIALASLGPGQQQVVDVQFQPGGQCGQSYGIGYVGSVDPAAHSMRPANLLGATLGQGGTCAPFGGCVADASPAVQPDNGLYANPARFGNGIGSFVIPTGQTTPPTYFGLWFTGEPNRNPTWYALQGDLVQAQRATGGSRLAQARSPVLRFRANIAQPVFPVPSSNVGTAQVTYVANDRYVLTYDIEGRRGGEIQSVLYPGRRSSPNRTGAWFFPQQSGWGFVADDHLINNVPDQVIITYLYDGNGLPRWSLGASPNLAGGTMAQNTFLVHCPNCPSFPDFLNFPLPAGSINPTYSTLTGGSFSSTVTWPAPPLVGGWNRSNVPIQMINPPGPQ